MPVCLLVGPDRHLGNVRVEHTVREDELDMRGAFAARAPFVQLEAACVGQEVRLPHMLARLTGMKSPSP